MYLVPIEMTKEYAVKVGINPDKIVSIYIEGKLTEVYYTEVENEAVYHEIMKQISKAVSGCFTMNMLKKAIPVPKLVPIMAMMVKCTANLIPTGHRKVEFSSINF